MELLPPCPAPAWQGVPALLLLPPDRGCQDPPTGSTQLAPLQGNSARAPLATPAPAPPRGIRQAAEQLRVDLDLATWTWLHQRDRHAGETTGRLEIYKFNVTSRHVTSRHVTLPGELWLGLSEGLPGLGHLQVLLLPPARYSKSELFYADKSLLDMILRRIKH